MLFARPMALLSAAAITTVAAQSCSSNKLSVSYPAPEAADGWSYRLVAQGLSNPRGILFDKDGGLIVVDGGKGLKHLNLTDDGGTCLSVAKNTTLIKDEDLNHGLALSSDGKTLYASTEDKVYSWPYTPGRLDNSSRTTLVTNMSNSDHTTRTLLISPSQPHTLLVSRGSDSNQDSNAKSLDSGHSQIRSFDISAAKTRDGPYDFLDGKVWGWGLRNSVGVAEDPVHGGIFSVENSVDQLHRNGKDIHSDNPGEEMNFHGYINGSADGKIIKSTGEKNNYGYPSCLAVWSTDGFPDKGNLTTGNQFPNEDIDDNDTTDESCNADFVAPVATFQAHMAPLDVKFTKNGSLAFVSFHGSWDRADPVGYKISSIAFDENGMPQTARDSRKAATDILTTPDLSKCPDNCFRPVGLAWDSKERLWFSSDATGEIFVMERSARGSSGRPGRGGGGNGSVGGGDEDAGSSVKPTVVVGFLAVILALLFS